MIISIKHFYLTMCRYELKRVEVSNDCKSKYEELQSLGCCIEVEILKTGDVSLTITHPWYGDIYRELCKPVEAEEHLEMLIKRFDKSYFLDVAYRENH